MAQSTVKKNDMVVVIAGTDKGKRGRVIAVQPKTGRVIVEGVHIITRHLKKGRSQAMPQGGLLKREGAIHISNVMKVERYDERQARRRGPAAAPVPEA